MALKIARAWKCEVGGEDVVIGILSQGRRDGDDLEDVPQVYAAGCSVQDLERSRCGFGASAAGAVADLMRMLRPDLATWTWG